MTAREKAEMDAIGRIAGAADAFASYCRSREEFFARTAALVEAMLPTLVEAVMRGRVPTS